MLLSEIKTLFHKELDALYAKEEVDTFFYRMIEHYLGLDRFVLALEPYYTITKEEEQPLFEGLSQLKLEKPLQYILGEAHFMDLTLAVNEHVLIPRPETEELVRWVVNEFGVQSLEFGVMNDEKELPEPMTQNSKLKILDIGTGSGCIAIALAKAFPEAKVYALDVSVEALEVARENAKTNQVAIEFIQADILNLDLNLNVDLIISNPPYVREQEKEAMHNNVLEHEPSGALFVPDENPLLFYEAIMEYGQKHLNPKGAIFFEINQYLAEETRQILVDNHFDEVIVRKDIFGNFRMLKATRIGNDLSVRAQSRTI